MSNHAHLLVCSGSAGLAKFMRRLLTGYAVSYNLRHRRQGHLFQNRYKSMVCDGDKITNILNGKIVNAGTGASLTKGKILFQSEGAEVFFRRIDLRPVKK